MTATGVDPDRLGGLLEEEEKRFEATGTVLVIAGAEGLVLERLERGETKELVAARRLFIEAAAGAISPD